MRYIKPTCPGLMSMTHSLLHSSWKVVISFDFKLTPGPNVILYRWIPMRKLRRIITSPISHLAGIKSLRQCLWWHVDSSGGESDNPGLER